ncbi:extensin-like [Magnolia sinica]|uniref:extensin-like n=1 Tax=Magnolia sinica TaxID=86752 RepID=UPI0026590F77|nr:extensin-like [Magnolia sinica]
MGPPLLTLISILILAISPLHTHSSSPPSTIAPVGPSQPPETDSRKSQLSKVVAPSDDHHEKQQPQNHRHRHRHPPPPPTSHLHKAKSQRHHPVRRAPPPPPKINLGKKIGLLFLGIAAALQVAIVGFLSFKRWQISKIKDRFEALSI